MNWITAFRDGNKSKQIGLNISTGLPQSLQKFFAKTETNP